MRTISTAIAAALLLLATSLAGCTDQRLIHDAFSVSSDIQNVVVDAEVGDIHVRGVDTTRIWVDLLWHDHGDRNTVWSVQGKTLLITSRCDAWGECGADIIVDVPPGTRVTASTTEGDVAISGLRDTTVVDIGVGSADLFDVGGLADVSVDVGAVTGDRLTTSYWSSWTGHGTTRLMVDEPFELLEAEAGVGDILMLVPAGRYDVDAATSIGKVGLAGVIDDPSSDRRIHAETGTGGITIVGFGPSDVPPPGEPVL